MGSPQNKSDLEGCTKPVISASATITQSPPNADTYVTYSRKCLNIATSKSDSDDDEDDIDGEYCDNGDSKKSPADVDAEGNFLTPKDFKRKREKRLAMNRASARERRKRKRLLLEKMEEHVNELTKKNYALQEMNNSLVDQVRQQDMALVNARSAISTLSSEASTRVNLNRSIFRVPDSAGIQDQERLLSIIAGAAGQNTNTTVRRESDLALSEALAERQLLLAAHQARQQLSRTGLVEDLLGRGHVDLLSQQLGTSFPGTGLHGGDARTSFLFGGPSENTLASRTNRIGLDDTKIEILLGSGTNFRGGEISGFDTESVLRNLQMRRDETRRQQESMKK